MGKINGTNMKVNRKYVTTLPDLSEYTKLIDNIHQTQSLVQELIPRRLELTVEICTDCVFINDEHGAPIVAMQVGQNFPETMGEMFAMELRTLVSSYRASHF